LVRRRQIILTLVALTCLSIVAAVGSGSAAAWWAVLGVMAAGGAYLGLLHRVRRIMAEREFGALWGPSAFDPFSGPDLRVPASAVDTEGDTGLLPVRQPSQTWALIRFVVANLAGWALSPLVFVMTLVLGETPKDSSGQRWLANLQTAQDRLREQSLRTLAISAATTASVTAAGTVVAFTGTGAASATTVPGTATLSTGIGLTSAAPGATYRVVAGDTLGSIAARFGTTVAALTAANHLADPNLIFAGQLLAVGSGARPDVQPSWGTAAGTTYTVVAGDTLGSIADRFGTRVAALTSANHLADPNLIYVGEVLVLNGSGPAPAAPAPTRDPAPATSAGETAARVALAEVGKPYQWAGAGPYSFDCSGLAMYAWAHAGVSLPHYTVAQYADTTRISRSQLQPGDLVFYDTGGGAQPGHVTIYIGNGQIVTADSPGTVVRVEVIDWDGVPMGYGRVR
jgi:peptidoglycan endopeptidase LytE